MLQGGGMMRKTLYICDGCGEEHRDRAPTVVNPKKVYMVHPGETRNISLAEAAALQGFPPGYVWKGTPTTIAQMIANAMPAEMAGAIAGAVRAGGGA